MLPDCCRTDLSKLRRRQNGQAITAYWMSDETLYFWRYLYLAPLHLLQEPAAVIAGFLHYKSFP